MIAFEPGLYIRIEQLDGPRAPMPKPLDSGFSMDCAYRVLGLYSPSETADAYLVLSNDRDEIWFVSNRHARTVGLQADGAFRMPLAQWEALRTQRVA